MADIKSDRNNLVVTAGREGPRVTVLLPVRDAELWIAKAITSIKQQTYVNYEILLVDDQSQDSSVDIAKSIAGPAMRVIEGPGTGVADALAIGVLESETEYIVRMDADDISHPHRIAYLVDFLSRNPDHVLVGSYARLMDEQDQLSRVIRHPVRHDAIALRMCIMTAFVHPTVAFRRSAVIDVGNYRGTKGVPYPEDFDLWSRLQGVGKLGNIRKSLLAYRTTAGSVSSSSWEQLACATGRIAASNLARHIGMPAPTSEMESALTLFHLHNRPISFREFLTLESWLIGAGIRSGLRPAIDGLPSSTYLRPAKWLVKDTLMKNSYSSDR